MPESEPSLLDFLSDGRICSPECTSCREHVIPRTYSIRCGYCGGLECPADTSEECERAHLDDHDSDCSCEWCLEASDEFDPAEVYGICSHILEWDHKPDWVFHGEGPLHLGMELEVESRYDYHNGTGMTPAAGAETINKGNDDILFCKEDGSLNYGFEIVTHPMTLGKAMELIPWSTLEHLRKEGGFRSFNTESCGMHLHLSRRAFDPESGGDASSHLWKFLKFHYRNASEITRLAGRSSSEYASWNTLENESALTYAKKQDSNYSRYVAINLQNHSTIELRYFKGTLSTLGIKRNIQFAHSVYAYTKQVPYFAVKKGGLRWPAYLEWMNSNKGTYPQLSKFLEEDKTFNGKGF